MFTRIGAERRRAFTVIELLLVVCILAVLLGILMPVLGRSRRSANRTVCQSRMRDVWFAAQMYRLDEDRYPDAREALPALSRYGLTKPDLHCAIFPKDTFTFQSDASGKHFLVTDTNHRPWSGYGEWNDGSAGWRVWAD